MVAKRVVVVCPRSLGFIIWGEGGGGRRRGGGRRERGRGEKGGRGRGRGERGGKARRERPAKNERAAVSVLMVERRLFKNC